MLYIIIMYIYIYIIYVSCSCHCHVFGVLSNDISHWSQDKAIQNGQRLFVRILWRTISLAVTILNYVFVFAKFLTLSFNVQHPLANMWMRLKMGSILSILPKTNCWSRENDDNPWGFPWGFPLCLSQFTMVFPYFSMVFPCFAVVFP